MVAGWRRRVHHTDARRVDRDPCRQTWSAALDPRPPRRRGVSMTAAPGLVLDPPCGVRGRVTIPRAHNVAVRRALTLLVVGATGWMAVRQLAEAGAVAPTLSA